MRYLYDDPLLSIAEFPAGADPALPGMHTHEHTQVTILSPGCQVQARWLTEGGTLRHKRIGGPAICVTPGFQPHLVEPGQGGAMTLILVRPGPTGLAARYGTQDPFVQHIARLLRQASLSGGLIPRLPAESCAVVLMEHLRGEDIAKPSRPMAPGRLNQVIEYLHENLGADLSIQRLSQIARMSPFQFARQFKAGLGMPPHRYVLEKRVELAARLLRDAPDSIAEVAHLCGFATQAHLTTVFRRRMGSTPKAWRQSIGLAEIDKTAG